MSSVVKHQAYPKSCRLRKGLEFKRLYLEGTKYYTKYFVIFTKKGNGKIGIVVSKKVSKKAVERNLLKRRLRAIYRTNKQWFFDLDMVIVALPSSLSANYSKLLNDIGEHIETIHHRIN